MLRSYYGKITFIIQNKKMKKKKVLVIGGGGREHALIWKLAQSPRVDKIYAVPGNGGTESLADNIPIKTSDFDGLIQFVQKNDVYLTVVGPDNPLADGIVDKFIERGLKIFGPVKNAAKIESSKSFAKKFMQELKIPTADFCTFSDFQEAVLCIKKSNFPVVIKANGLALGKGVYVCKNISEAEDALNKLMVESVYGDAGKEVIIEEYLEGQEVSIHTFCDGGTAVLFPSAQDHKPIFDNDLGPNTGGMGTYAPVPWVGAELLDQAEKDIIKPVLEGLARNGAAFCGCLYPGLKITPQGVKVLEFNARFGDPETQSYMRLLKTDLLEIIEACVDKKLCDIKIEWNPGFAVCIVLASAGYPGPYKKGTPIFGIDEAEKLPGIVVFHAGTELKDGRLFTSGGRVLGVTAIGKTLSLALDRAYEAVKLISFEGMQYRKDIGAKALNYEREIII